MPYSMYDRTVKPIPQRPTIGLRYRVETLLGFTGLKMAKYRSSWWDVFWCPFNVAWRPQLLGILIFEVSSPTSHSQYENIRLHDRLLGHGIRVFSRAQCNMLLHYYRDS